jgi:hypothetical protein
MNNNCNDKKIFTYGRMVEWRSDTIKSNDCLTHTDEGTAKAYSICVLTKDTLVIRCSNLKFIS